MKLQHGHIPAIAAAVRIALPIKISLLEQVRDSRVV
jgi:hypothetical protein